MSKRLTTYDLRNFTYIMPIPLNILPLAIYILYG